MLQLISGLEREQLEVALDVGVVGVHPELVQLVRRRERGLEPERARLALAELGAGRRGDEWGDQAVRFSPPFHPPDEIDAGGDVPPLIAAAHLDGAALAPEQV